MCFRLQIPVHNYKDLDILVSVTDSNGRKFDNFSSLEFDWTLSNTNAAQFGNENEMQLTTESADSGKVIPTCKYRIYLRKIVQKGFFLFCFVRFAFILRT